MVCSSRVLSRLIGSSAYNSSTDEGQTSPERDTETTVISSLHFNTFKQNLNRNLNICTDINTITFYSNSQSTALISPLEVLDSIVVGMTNDSKVMDA